jgi:hypothetical protein
MEKLSKDNYKELLTRERNNLYTFLEEYKTSKSPILCKCNKCKNEWKVSPYEIIKRKSNCPICSRKKSNENKKLTNDEIQNRLNDYYILLEDYNGINKKINVKCKKCGYEFSATPNNLLNSKKNQHMCKNCFNNRRRERTSIKYQQSLDKFFGKEKSYDLLEDYQGLDTKILHKCKICGYEWKVTPNNINLAIYRDKVKRVCPGCNNLKRSNKDYNERLKDINSVFVPIEKYINLRTKIKHKCKICNMISEVIPNNAVKGSGCKYCSNKINQSKYEKDIIEYIKNNYNINIIEKDRNILNGKELDIYLPEKNLAIEVNGLYYHCDDYKGKNYHLNKTKICKEKGIKLLQIFDDFEKNKVYSLLNQYLNDDFKEIDKRYNIKDITKNTAIKFLKENSLNINKNMTIQLGLYIENKLISVLTFNKNYLTNFSVSINSLYDIKILFNYLFEYFKNNYSFKKIYYLLDISNEEEKSFDLSKNIEQNNSMEDIKEEIKIEDLTIKSSSILEKFLRSEF